ncbi:MAG: hypothetical protein JWR59_2376 [Brevundimonas sp.]|nr:hypothetical protein [Brevundimonas sp.]
MKRLILVLAVGAATLAGCDEPRREQTETVAAPVEAAPAPPPPVEAPPPEPVKPTTEPSTVTALPPDERSSAETVKPESETLFY